MAVDAVNKGLNLILGRRSVRAYTDEPVADEAIRALLDAAMAAPSAVGRDPWRFIVMKERATREAVAAALPNGKMLIPAPLGFVVLGDLAAAHDGQLGYLLQDCSAAIENLLLAAHALGLGACWLGVYPRQERMDHLRALFSLPEHIVPVACISVGHPAEQKAARTRYNEAFVHREKW